MSLSASPGADEPLPWPRELDAAALLTSPRPQALMNRYPGHVSSMLQLSEVCRLGEDLALSAELLERALFTLEAAAHPVFSVTSGAARLDYRRRENR